MNKIIKPVRKQPEFRSGMILEWDGLIADIPDGFSLCDGTNGTPDLRDKFIKGASAGVEAGGEGGCSSHDHAVAGTTAYCSGCYSTSSFSCVGVYYSGMIHMHSFCVTSSSENNLPPYYETLFIMKD